MNLEILAAALLLALVVCVFTVICVSIEDGPLFSARVWRLQTNGVGGYRIERLGFWVMFWPRWSEVAKFENREEAVREFNNLYGWRKFDPSPEVDIERIESVMSEARELLERGAK